MKKIFAILVFAVAILIYSIGMVHFLTWLKLNEDFMYAIAYFLSAFILIVLGKTLWPRK